MNDEKSDHELNSRTSTADENMNTIIRHADCFDVLPTLQDKSVDLVLADLPFGTTACEWDDPRLRHERRKSMSASGAINIPALWGQYNRIVKTGGAICLFSSQRFTALLIASNFNNFAYTWSWDKRFAANFAQAKRMPLLVCEDIAVFSTTGKLPRYFPIMEERDTPIRAGGNSQYGKAIRIQDTAASRRYGEDRPIYTQKSPTNLLAFNCREQRGLHPTQKPVSLCEYLIQTYSNPGDTVLDNCMGSGTTGVAALALGRAFIGIERDEKYFQIAHDRLNAVAETRRTESAG